MKTHQLIIAVLVTLVLSPAVLAQFASSQTSTVTLAVAAEASIRIDTAAASLTSVGTLFANYTGTTNFTYKVRTSKTSGSGSVTLQVTGDFSPTGGPSVANSGTTGNTLTYTCSESGAGTGCATTQTASTTAATTVISFGTNDRSAKNGDTGSVSWTLVNDPQYETGNYSATVTWTISAT